LRDAEAAQALMSWLEGRLAAADAEFSAAAQASVVSPDKRDNALRGLGRTEALDRALDAVRKALGQAF
jgi:hypothetical protein